MNTRQSLGTCIAAPKRSWMALHVPLQHLVIVLRNMRRNFSFEVQVLDSLGFLRRFNMATWFTGSGSMKKTPYLCQLPLVLQLGWNEIHLDLNDLLWRSYKSTFVETERLIINATCRLRQVRGQNALSNKYHLQNSISLPRSSFVRTTSSTENSPFLRCKDLKI